jgi:hypothetical protein
VAQTVGGNTIIQRGQERCVESKGKVMKIHIGKAIGQGTKQDWHINYEADGGRGTDP